MVTNRTRLASHGTAYGIITNVALGGESVEEYSLGTSKCEDTIGNYPNPNGLIISHASYVRLGTVTGRPPTFPVFDLNNVKTGSQEWFDHAPLSSVVKPSDTQVATEAISRANPSRPTVDLPVDIGEILFDLPRFFEQQLRPRAERSSGSVGVGFQFGLAPLLNDLQRLLQFGADVNKRSRLLKEAYSSRGVHTRANIWADSAQVVEGPFTIWSLEGADVTCNVSRTSFIEEWGTALWRPDIIGEPPSDEELIQTAREVVHGWRLSPSTLWELMPWSWLADYFGNVGSYLGAIRNSVGISPTNICVMEHAVTRSEQIILSCNDWLSCVPGISKYETKMRRLGDLGVVGYSVPFMGPRQLTNLIDIARSRSRGLGS